MHSEWLLRKERFFWSKHHGSSLSTWSSNFQREADLCHGRGVCHSQRVSTELLVLMVGTGQSSHVCLVVEGRADLERWGGRCCHAAQGQTTLMRHARLWHGPSGGQSLELGVDLGVGSGQVWGKAGAWGMGGMWWAGVRHVHSQMLRGGERVRVGERARGRVLAWVTRVDWRFGSKHWGRGGGGSRGGGVGRLHFRWVTVTLERIRKHYCAG